MSETRAHEDFHCARPPILQCSGLFLEGCKVQWMCAMVCEIRPQRNRERKSLETSMSSISSVSCPLVLLSLLLLELLLDSTTVSRLLMFCVWWTLLLRWQCSVVCIHVCAHSSSRLLLAVL